MFAFALKRSCRWLMIVLEPGSEASQVPYLKGDGDKRHKRRPKD
jgi:hypothetical protein